MVKIISRKGITIKTNEIDGKKSCVINTIA